EDELPKGKVDEDGDEILDLEDWKDDLTDDVDYDLSKIKDDMLEDETEEEELGLEVDDVVKMLRDVKCKPCPGLRSKPDCKIAHDHGCPKIGNTRPGIRATNFCGNFFIPNFPFSTISFNFTYVSAAENLFKLFKSLDLKLTDFEIKRNIIEKNLYGIEIEKPACIISKLQLIKWLLSDKNLPSNFIDLNTNTLNTKDINHFFNKLNLKLNIFHEDFLLDVNSITYDIIIGNPPYIENKKIKGDGYKKKLTKRFKSAFRLFDLSIVFLERALELLKQGSGYLSMIIT
ncbi:unnamed protein product, partial [marine sediment metagenome]